MAIRSEMSSPEAAHVLELLAALSRGSNFSVGCSCEEESHCHRSVLRALLIEKGAIVVPPPRSDEKDADPLG
jgi:uncharacterized protein YeaO (DUF488 family)